jgi:hypothetical protein
MVAAGAVDQMEQDQHLVEHLEAGLGAIVILLLEVPPMFLLDIVLLVTRALRGHKDMQGVDRHMVGQHREVEEEQGVWVVMDKPTVGKVLAKRPVLVVQENNLLETDIRDIILEAVEGDLHKVGMVLMEELVVEVGGKVIRAKEEVAVGVR